MLRRSDRVHSSTPAADDQVKITSALVNLTASAGLNAGARGLCLAGESGRRRKSLDREDTPACDTALNILPFPRERCFTAIRTGALVAPYRSRKGGTAMEIVGTLVIALVVGIGAQLIISGRDRDGYQPSCSV